MIEQEALKRLRDDMMDGGKFVMVEFLDLRALLNAYEKIQLAIGKAERRAEQLEEEGDYDIAAGYRFAIRMIREAMEPTDE